MTSQELKDRTKAFAKACLKLLKDQKQSNRLFWHIESQLIRSSTSVAANYRAACIAQSRAAFIAKLSIVIEEVDECNFWLELMEEEYTENPEAIIKQKEEALELTKIFVATRKSLRGENGK